MVYTDQELLTRIIESYQARCPRLNDFNVGEIMLGLAEGDRDVAADLLFQAERQLNRAMIDAAVGDDLETLLAGFNFPRQQAVPATTSLRFSVNAPATADVTIPAGTLVSTIPEADEEPVEFATDEAATLEAGETYVDVAATATLGGAAGNVTDGALVEVLSELPGVDAVTNPSRAVEGRDAWSDADYRAAFRGYLAGLGRATPAAVEGRALQVPGVASVHLRENHPSRGYNTLYVTNGSEESASFALLQSVADALGDEFRATGTSLSVEPATVTTVDVALTLTARPGYSLSAVRAAVVAAITRYLRALPCARDVRLSRLVQYAMTVPGVQDLAIDDVGGGGAQNLTIGPDAVANPGTVSFA